MAQILKSIGAIMRTYNRTQYYLADNGDVAIYKDYRFHWFRPLPDGGYERTGQITIDRRGAALHDFSPKRGS